MRELGRAAAAALSLLLACGGHGVFACDDDASCTNGRCEPTGFCSFPDPTCPSGRRYGSLSGDGLAEQCVTPEAVAADTSSGTSSGDGVTGNAAEGAAADASSGAVATSLPVDGGEVDTGPAETTTAVPGPDLGGPPLCSTEDFDDDTLDGWIAWTDEVPMTFADGMVTFALSDTLATHAGIDAAELGFADARLDVVWSEFPSPASGTQIMIGVVNGDEAVLMLRETDRVFVRYSIGDVLSDSFEITFDEAWTHWRMHTGGDDGVVFEYGDGSSWTVLGNYVPPFDLAGSYPFLSVGTWQVVAMPGLARVDSLTVCSPG